MTTRTGNKTCGNRCGVALLLVLVVLIILSGIVYSLSSRITLSKHRQQYIIDYQKARYACDSGLKYAFTLIPKMDLTPKERTEDFPDLWDFSDTFSMNREEYIEFLTDWLQARMELEAEEAAEAGEEPSLPESLLDNEMFATLFGAQDANTWDSNTIDSSDYVYGPELDDIKIPGPYNCDWPNVIEPIEFEMADAKVTIRIEDENAKFPLIWAMQGTDREMSRIPEVALETFCDWMRMGPEEGGQIDQLKDQALEMAKYKRFQLAYKPITVTEIVKPKPSTSKTSTSSRNRRTVTRATKRTVKKQREPAKHAADFAKIIHGSGLNLVELAMPIEDTEEERAESPLKYMGLWGATKVNINTAPRHVLEAAFTFGGQAEDIAEEIIQLRRVKPFKDMKDMAERMYGFSDSLKKMGPYITMKSEYLTIKITARYGKARTTSIAAVIKTKSGFSTIASFSY